MKAAIYTRVSHEFQLEGYSLPAQLEACKAYADLHHHTVVATYEERGESGRRDNRTQFQNMLKDAEMGRFDLVIVHKLDRFSRRLKHLITITDQLQDLGVSVVSVTEKIDYSTPHGKLQRNMLGSLAEWYSDNLALETKKGQLQRAQAGKQSGRIAYGYKSVDDIAVPDPETAPVVKLIFEMFASGEYAQQHICDTLNAKGYRTAGGKIWQTAILGYMLKNPFYMGKLPFHGEILDGEHEAIVSQELWHQAQLTRAQRAKQQSKLPRQRLSHRKRHLYIFSGLVHCNCGGNHIYRGFREKDGRPVYRSYDVDCTTRPKAIDVGDLLNQVEQKLIQHLKIPRAWQKDIIEHIESMHTQPTDDDHNQKINAAVERLKKLYLWEHITEYEYRSQKEQLESQLIIIEPQQISRYETMLTMLEDFPAIWDAATNIEQRQLARLLFDQLILDGRDLCAVKPTNVFFQISIYKFLLSDLSIEINIIPPTAA